jgi:hypothetical protein
MSGAPSPMKVTFTAAIAEQEPSGTLCVLRGSCSGQPRSTPGTRQLPDVSWSSVSDLCNPGAGRRFFHRLFGRGVLGIVAAGLVLSDVLTGVVARGQAPTRIVFVARVDNVYDPGEALRDTIHVDDFLRGTMTYDINAADSDARPDVGRYEHHHPPYGILIEAGPFVFQTDPKRVDFSIVVSKAQGVPPRNSYVVTSANNLPLQNGAAVSRISWELVDDSLTALNSATLPAIPPDLDKWQSEFGLTLEGRSPVEFIIRAHVIEAKLCASGMRCPSPD